LRDFFILWDILEPCGGSIGVMILPFIGFSLCRLFGLRLFGLRLFGLRLFRVRLLFLHTTLLDH
jgi:hypothetical protein